jgi:hypothetical protein
MTWNPTYQADFTKRVVRQLLALVQRDQRDALDWVGGQGNLRSIQSYHVAAIPVLQFPAVLIAPMRSTFDQEAVGTRHSTSAYYCAVRDIHQDAEVVADRLQDYVQALDAIFMSLPLSDFQQSWPLILQPTQRTVDTVPLATGTLKELFVTSHNYDEIRQTKNGFHFAAAMEISIEREEA